MGKGAPPRKRAAGKPAVGMRDLAARAPGKLGLSFTLRGRVPRLPARALVAGCFAAACGVAVYWGVPSPGVSPGDRADRTYVARVPFTAVDPAGTGEKKRRAAEATPSVYHEKRNWSEDLLKTLRDLLAVVEESPGRDAARLRLSAKGHALDVAPVWDCLRGGGEASAEGLVASARKIALELERVGVISDERFEIESRSGRHGIVRGERDVLLEDGKGVVNVSAARERAEAALRSIHPERPKLAGALAEALSHDLGPSLVYDDERTRYRRDAAARAAPEVEIDVAPGRVLAREGDRIDQTEYAMIQREVVAWRTSRSATSHGMRLAGILVTVALIAGILAACTLRLSPASLATVRSVFFAGLIDLLVVLAARGLVVAGLPPLLAPVALASIIFALTVSPLFAAMNAVALAAVVSIASGPGLALPLGLCAGAVAGGLAAARARRRSELLMAGVVAGIVQLFTVGGVKLGTGVEEATVLLEWGGWALMNGFGCGLVGLGLLGLAEKAFGVTTDISLLEYSDQNNKALKRLLTEAPGTYHHSLIVGNLSEAAADALCENALLARVASYYHDLGKVDRPEYFIENEPPGRSRHEGLSPTMSTLIITAHVRDGVALGREHHLPTAILDVIREHHGTSTVEYFYREALDRAAADEGAPQVDRQLFRYEGPKPQSREAGIVLLADSVEAASRSLEEPTSARLSKLVHDIAMSRLLDGQFDESGLTLRDLRTVETVFVRVLASMFHARMPYPSASPPPKVAALMRQGAEQGGAT